MRLFMNLNTYPVILNTLFLSENLSTLKMGFKFLFSSSVVLAVIIFNDLMSTIIVLGHSTKDFKNIGPLI